MRVKRLYSLVNSHFCAAAYIRTNTVREASFFLNTRSPDDVFPIAAVTFLSRTSRPYHKKGNRRRTSAGERKESNHALVRPRALAHRPGALRGTVRSCVRETQRPRHRGGQSLPARPPGPHLALDARLGRGRLPRVGHHPGTQVHARVRGGRPGRRRMDERALRSRGLVSVRYVLLPGEHHHLAPPLQGAPPLARRRGDDHPPLRPQAGLQKPHARRGGQVLRKREDRLPHGARMLGAARAVRSGESAGARVPHAARRVHERHHVDA